MKYKEWNKLRIDKKFYTLERINNANAIPEVVFNQYNTLWNMYDKGEYYGALYQVKDVLELSLKFPILIILALAAKIMKNVDEPDVDMSSIRRGLYKKFDDFLFDILSCNISFGSLEKFGRGLALIDEMMVPSKYRDSFLATQKVLQAIVPGYYHAVSLDGELISNWRNRAIGHGALDANKENIKRALEPVLKNLNAIMSVSDYTGIHISYENKSYSVWTEDESKKINLYPYIILNDESEIDSFCGNLLSSYLFDTYNYHREQAFLLDYINNKKIIHENLAFILTGLAKKLKANRLSSNAIDSGDINESDEKAIMSMEPKEIVAMMPFFEETKKLLEEEKGILLLRSERGTGKTVFSRTILNNFDSESANKYQLRINDRDVSDISSLLMPEDAEEELYVCVYNFNNSWMYTVTSFGKAIRDSLNPKKADHPNYFNKESAFIELLYNGKEKHKSDYQEKLRKAFNELLKAAHEIYSEATPIGCKLLVVLDGIDEIPDKENSICIQDLLDKDMLPDNVYILILARTEHEWNLPKPISDCCSLKAEISKERFEDILKDYAKQNLPDKGFDSIYLQDLVEKADMKILHLQIMCYIIKLRYSRGDIEDIREIDFLKLPEIYAEEFRSVSPSYYVDIKKLMATISLLSEPATINELYNVFTAGRDVHPDFKFFALLKDLRGFLSVDRKNGLNYYSIANKAWQEGLGSKYFAEDREEVRTYMLETVSAILGKNMIWNSADIEFFKSAMLLKDENCKVAECILSYIEDSCEKLDNVFQSNYPMYMEIVDFIKSKEFTEYGLNIQLLYVWILLNSIARNEAYIHDIALDECFCKITFDIQNKKTFYASDAFYRSLLIIDVALKATYGLNPLDGPRNIDFAKAYIEICVKLLRKNLIKKNGDILFDLLLGMKSISVEYQNDKMLFFLGDCLEELHNRLESKYLPFYDLTRFQFDLIYTKKANKNSLDKEFLETEKLLADAKTVAESDSLSNQEKARYFKRLFCAYDVPGSTSFDSLDWKDQLINKNLIPIDLVGEIFINEEILRTIHNARKACSSSLDYQSLLRSIKLLGKHIDKSKEDSYLALYYYYLETKFVLRKELGEEGFSLEKIVQEFGRDLRDFQSRSVTIDYWLVAAFYLKAELYAVENELLDYAEFLLKEYKNIVKKIDAPLTENILLFSSNFNCLIKKLIAATPDDKELFDSLLPAISDIMACYEKSYDWNKKVYYGHLFQNHIRYAKFYHQRRNFQYGYEQCLSAVQMLNLKGICGEKLAAIFHEEYEYLHDYFKALGLRSEFKFLKSGIDEEILHQYLDSYNEYDSDLYNYSLDLYENYVLNRDESYVFYPCPNIDFLFFNKEDFLDDLALAVNDDELRRWYCKKILQRLSKQHFFSTYDLPKAFKCCEILKDYRYILDICNKNIGEKISSRDICHMDSVLPYLAYREKTLRIIGDIARADKDRRLLEKFYKAFGLAEEDLQNMSIDEILDLVRQGEEIELAPEYK